MIGMDKKDRAEDPERWAGLCEWLYEEQNSGGKQEHPELFFQRCLPGPVSVMLSPQLRLIITIHNGSFISIKDTTGSKKQTERIVLQKTG